VLRLDQVSIALDGNCKGVALEPPGARGELEIAGYEPPLGEVISKKAQNFPLTIVYWWPRLFVDAA
jgi:hypothetical protein